MEIADYIVAEDRRLGESGIMGRYFIYDLLSPLWAAVLWVMLLRRDDRVWR